MQQSVAKNSGDSLNLLEILLIAWRAKWMVLGIALLIVALSVAYVVHAKNWYRAEILLKPMDSRSAEGQSTQLGVMSGLASLAGLGAANNPSAEPLAVLSSREFTGAFITDQKLMPVLYAKLWNPATNSWRPDVKHPPDVRDAIGYFTKQVRTVTEDKKTGLVTMTIEWTDPTLAANWANLLIERVNDHMRARALTEAEANVAYLKDQLAASSLVTLQESIGRVLESELQKLMLARENREFAFRILDHAFIPKRPVSPQVALILVAAVIGGLGIGVLCALFANVMRRHRTLPTHANSA